MRSYVKRWLATLALVVVAGLAWGALPAQAQFPARYGGYGYGHFHRHHFYGQGPFVYRPYFPVSPPPFVGGYGAYGYGYGGYGYGGYGYGSPGYGLPAYGYGVPGFGYGY